MFKSYTFKGAQKGANILILGAVHGNETAGTFAQQKIIEQIQKKELILQAGQITFLPIVNEAAYQKDCRFVDINLNRVVRFHQQPKNNEEKIANELIKLIDACDVMLDLHSTHCPDDEAFAFIDYPTALNKELLSLIPVKTALAGWPQIYAGNSAIENYCTEEYAHRHGKRGITVECGYHKAPLATDIAKQSILNVLAYFKNIAQEPIFYQPKEIMLHSFIIKQQEGRFSKNYQHLDKITQGETLAVYESGEQITAPFDGCIIMPNPTANIGDEWFYYGL